MVDQQIAAASVHLLEMPLKRAYPLSFRTIEHLDMILVRLVGEDGRQAIGESCALPPYSAETPGEVWDWLSSRVTDIVGRPADEVLASADSDSSRASAFSSVALTSACESLVDPVDTTAGRAVPVVGIVLGSSEESTLRDVEELLAAGYWTLKVKVGFDPIGDARKVEQVLRNIPAEVMVRTDANQGWTLDQASEFASALDLDAIGRPIELLEQPFPRERWDWVEAFSRDYPQIPVMLDESIEAEASVRRAADAGARLVKFKLVKAGTRRRLGDLRALSEELGLGVVVGNGTGGVVDNWYEAQCIDPDGLAGEMNGALKVVDPIVAERPILADGLLSFPANFDVTTSLEDLCAKSVKSLVLG